MVTHRSSLTAALISTMLLAGCIPAERYDSEFKGQFQGRNAANNKRFASGYFPPAFAEPQVDCGHVERRIELISEHEAKWYPEQWQAAREPSFYLLSSQEPPPEFALRFSYLPSFDPSVFIRVEKKGDEYWLIAKQMDGAGGYDPGAIDRSKRVRLSSDEVAEMQRLLGKGALFGEPASGCEFGFDGSRWIFEKIDSKGYRMVTRSSPDEGAAYNLGRYLIELSGWNISCQYSLPRPFSDVGLFCEYR